MSDQSQLRFLSWNADGVRRKQHDLYHLAVSTLCVDVVALCETKLSPNVQIIFPGFTCHRQDKHNYDRGQGVAILVKNNIEHSLLCLPHTEHIEAVGIKTEISGIEFIIISVYQSPNLPLLVNDIDLLLSLGPRVLLMGDFNANHEHWHKGLGNIHGRRLFHHMLDRDFIIHASKTPSLIHYRGDHNATNPDLVLSLGVDHISEVKTIPALSSNHLPLFFTVCGRPTRNPPVRFYKYDRADWKGYRSFLDENISLSSRVFNKPSEIDDAVAILHKYILEARDRFVPTGTKQLQQVKLPRKIKRIIKHRNFLRRIEQNSVNPIEKRSIRNNINQFQTLIQNEIQSHLDKIWNQKLAQVDNPSSDIWRLAKSLRNKSTGIAPLKVPQTGAVVTSPDDQSEALADAFHSNMCLTNKWNDDEMLADIQSALTTLDATTVSNKLENPTRPREIWRSLRKLKCRKSPGEDNIHNTLLKNLSQKAVVYLTKIINGCIFLNYFPKIWKFAKVIAIKKSGKDESIPSSYRPISLLPALGKLFESIIYTRLKKSTKHLLKSEQFGFRDSHSTTQQLARVAEHISHRLNLKESTGMILVDIEKAFDTVWHDGLIYKLLKCQVPINLVKLIGSYLKNRYFSVHIGDRAKSRLRSMPAGVPQGSILGPYLFLLYVNDIPVQPRTSLACFADDTASFTSSNDVDLIVSRLQLSLENLHSYFTKWKLKLNEGKTEAILFSRHRNEPKSKLKIGGHTIPWAKSVRYLGVTLDKKLNWSKHISNIRRKGIVALNSLNPILNRHSNLSSHTKLRIYTTLVRPCITYAAPVWNSTCDTNYRFLQVIQNKALKISYNTPYRTNLHELHTSINLPLLRDFVMRQTRKFFDNNPSHSNKLVAMIGQTRIDKFIDTYGTYRLPHHYLFCPD